MGQYQEAVSRSQGLRGAARVVGSIKQAAAFSWESRHHKYSPLGADYAGYSSEASADDGRCVQEEGWVKEGRIKCNNTHTHKKTQQKKNHPIREISASLLLLFNRRRRIASSPPPPQRPQSALIAPQDVARRASHIVCRYRLPPHHHPPSLSPH